MEDAIDALFQAFWVDYKDTTKASLLTEIILDIFADQNTTGRIVNEVCQLRGAFPAGFIPRSLSHGRLS